MAPPAAAQMGKHVKRNFIITFFFFLMNGFLWRLTRAHISPPEIADFMVFGLVSFHNFKKFLCGIIFVCVCEMSLCC